MLVATKQSNAEPPRSMPDEITPFPFSVAHRSRIFALLISAEGQTGPFVWSRRELNIALDDDARLRPSSCVHRSNERRSCLHSQRFSAWRSVDGIFVHYAAESYRSLIAATIRFPLLTSAMLTSPLGGGGDDDHANAPMNIAFTRTANPTPSNLLMDHGPP